MGDPCPSDINSINQLGSVYCRSSPGLETPVSQYGLLGTYFYLDHSTFDGLDHVSQKMGVKPVYWASGDLDSRKSLDDVSNRVSSGGLFYVGIIFGFYGIAAVNPA